MYAQMSNHKLFHDSNYLYSFVKSVMCRQTVGHRHRDRLHERMENRYPGGKIRAMTIKPGPLSRW